MAIINLTKFDIPNILTFSRLIFTPIFVIIFYFDNDTAKILSGIIFALAGISDFLDGYLARQWHAQSNIGRILDPIADKLIIIAAIVMLIYHHKIENIHVFAAMIILLREVIVSGLREALSSFNFDLPVSNLGKFKTAIQILSIIILIFSDFKSVPSYINLFGIQLFWVAAFLSLYSGWQYIKQTINYLKQID